MIYHSRFSTRGKKWNVDPAIHLVYDANLRTFCGRNAADWHKIDNTPEISAFTCERCKKALEVLNVIKLKRSA